MLFQGIHQFTTLIGHEALLTSASYLKQAEPKTVKGNIMRKPALKWKNRKHYDTINVINVVDESTFTQIR